MENREVSTWLQFALQQIAAECYLNGVPLEDKDAIRLKLIDGNNNSSVLGPNSIFNGKTRFTPLQAIQFLQDYDFLDHHENDASGFSATLLFNPVSNSYTLSFRSTEYRNAEEGGDFERDGGLTVEGACGEIFEHGFALAQLLAMETYYEEIRHAIPQGRLNVTGYSLGGHLATVFTEMHSEEIAQTYVFNSPGRGDLDRGGLVGETDPARFPLMLARLKEVMFDPSKWSPDSNTPALDLALFEEAKALAEQDPDWNPFTPGSTQNIYLDPRYQWAKKAVVSEFRPDFSVLSEAQADGAFEKIHSIVGFATRGDFTLVAGTQNHPPLETVFIEDQPTWDEFGGLFSGDGDFGTSHSLTLIVDSLALQELFLSLDSNLDQKQVETILAASGFQSASTVTLTEGFSEGDSLENALDALYEVFTGSSARTPFNRDSGGFGNIENRQKYHLRIQEVAQLAKATGSFLKIESLVGKTADEIATIATGVLAEPDRAIAFRHALKRLNPFAVVGADYSIHNEAGELDVYDPTTGQGEVTLEWIRDRADMLAALNEARSGNRQDENTGWLRAATGQVMFSSSENADEPLRIAPQGLYLATRFVTFGGENGDQIFGGSLADGLYGNGGNDTINGLEGSDTIEGGQGEDVLSGGRHSDILRGGPGEDRLDGGSEDDSLFGGQEDDEVKGGTGNDLLEGGEGFDTYVFTSGDGVDTIIDSDGSGRLLIDGVAIQDPEGLNRIGDSWLLSEGGQLFSLHLDASAVEGPTLTISGVFHGQVRINDFRNGDLGIVLNDAWIDTHVLQPTINKFPIPGRFENYVNAIGTDDADFAEYGEDWGFFGRAGNDLLGQSGIPGGWHYFGNAGDDVLIGGEGVLYYETDHLYGGGGADRIVGEGGNDLLYGDFEAEFSSSRFVVDSFMYFWEEGAPSAGIFVDRSVDWTIEDPHIYFDDVETALQWIVGANEHTDFETYFNDRIDGGNGDDHLLGMAGSDDLVGGAGDDWVEGDTRIVTPGSRDQFLQFRGLFGNYGNDFLDGGAGNDRLYDEVAGNDILLGGAGDDTLSNAERLAGQADNELFLADSLTGTEAFVNYLDGGDGNDVIKTTNHYGGGRDVLIGGKGNDSLQASGFGVQFELDAGEGDDVLTMAFGVFQADGGKGDDRYTLISSLDNSGVNSQGFPYHFVPSTFRIRDMGDDGNDTVEFLIVESADQLQVFREGDDLKIELEGFQNWITIDNWYAGQEWKIEKFVIQSWDPVLLEVSQTEWSVEEIERRAIWRGTEGPDHLAGGSGDQTILGGAGDDILEGGSGNDILSGGTGSDVYRFGVTSGNDVIFDESEATDVDEVLIADGLSQTDVTVGRAEDDLVLQVTASGSSLTIANWFREGLGKVERVRFEDGTRWTRAQLNGMAMGNHAPTVAGSVENQFANSNAHFSFELPSGLFHDADELDTLTYGMTLATGAELPSWLTFDPDHLTLSGTPPASHPGTLKLLVSAKDRADAKANLMFNLTILDANSAPEVVEPLSDASATEGVFFEMFVSGNAFRDPDSGDVVALTAALASGESLPSWLVFDPDARRFFGMPGEGDVGEMLVRVAAQDGSGASVEDDFRIDVRPHPGRRSMGSDVSEVLEGHSGGDRLYGMAGDDHLQGKSGDDTLDGGAGRDSIDGGSEQDLLRGGPDEDSIYGGSGNDILRGGEGNDDLLDASGRSVLDGGSGDDVLVGADGGDLFIGGRGDDNLSIGEGASVVAFNRGDGRDNIESSTDAQATLSLGKGVSYRDLTFRRDAGDLVLDLGSSDQITFRDWYTQTPARGFARLQFIAEAMGGGPRDEANPLQDQRVETFDFRGLAESFDAAGQVDGWALTNALLDLHLAGSDSEALGGDLAYEYGMSGIPDRIGTSASQAILGTAEFGAAAQAIRPKAQFFSALSRLSGLDFR